MCALPHLQGRLTLLLGPPGSGKSTLLKALSGKLDMSSLRVTSGSVSYNGRSLDEFVIQRTAAYIEQRDNHIAELTVSTSFFRPSWDALFSVWREMPGSHRG